MHCVTPDEFAPLFRALDEFVEMCDEQRQKQPMEIIQRIEFGWAGQEKLFLQLLRLRDVSVAGTILGHCNPPSLPGLGTLNIGPIYWWLEWMMEVSSSHPNYWFLEQIGALFGSHLDPKVHQELVAEFNKSSSQFRSLLSRFLLPYLPDITTDMFSEDAISFLFADLSYEGKAFSFRGHLLGRTATEEFVTERLLPLLGETKEPLLGKPSYCSEASRFSTW